MTDIYDSLCVVKTAIANSLGAVMVHGRSIPINYTGLLQTLADEVNEHYDFINGLHELSIDELEDLGFGFLDDDSDLMLFPIWLFPFIPDDTELEDIDGDLWIKGEDLPMIYADQWLNVGIYVD